MTFLPTLHAQGDSARYIHSSTAVQFIGNDTSWVSRTVGLEAAIDVSVGDARFVADGLGGQVLTIPFTESLEGSFSLTVEGSDRPKDLRVSGQISRTLVRHVDPFAITAPAQRIQATLALDGFPGPGLISTCANMQAFPPPGSFASMELNQLQLAGLEERTPLAAGMEVPLLGRGSNGPGGRSAGGMHGTWTVMEAGADAPAKSLVLNISLEGEGVSFSRACWMSGENPFPLRQETRSVTLETTNSGVETITLSGHRELVDGSLRAGGGERMLPVPSTVAPPEEGGSGVAKVERHPDGEFARWDLIPSAGRDFYGRSSLVFPCDEALEAATQSGTAMSGLSGDGGSGCVVRRATFNASQDKSDPAGIAGEYSWNLTLTAPGDEGGARPAAESSAVVVQTVKRAGPGGEYLRNTSVVWESGAQKTTLCPVRAELAEEMLTLASSEELMRHYGDVDEALTGSLGRDELDGLTFGLYFGGTPGVKGASGPGALAEDSMMDLRVPDTAYLWHMSKEVDASTTVSACVDAQTGALLYVMSVEGARSQPPK